MTWADKTKKGVEGWFTTKPAPDKPSWSERIRDWIIGWIAGGVTQSLEDMEPGAIESFKAVLTQRRDDPLTPPEMKAFYEKALTPGNWLTELIAGLTLPLGAFGALLGGSIPLGNLMRYVQDKELKSSRLDVNSAITAWRRDPEKYAAVFEDLREQGWSEDRIEALKFVTLFYPAPADLVRWQAREVFEPEMIAKYGLDDEFGRIEKEPFYKAGMTDEQILNYWRAHWEHASWMQIVEMLHRGLITEEDTYEWFRVVEIVPYWRDLLIQTAYTWPTRVDVRRWWDMRTIDEAELRRLYSGMGYRGVNLDNYVLWTKVYVAFPDLLARWSNGWITLEEVKAKLTALGMPAERVEEFIQAKVKAEQPARTVNERDLTKTDIIKGVKTERISRGEGIELLMELGYDEDEADYILAINIPTDQVDSVVRDRQLTKSDVIAGLRTDVLTEEEARDKLLELRYTSTDVQLLLDIFNASIKPPAEERQRQASKADIVLAVKKDLITPEEGYLMLQDIGFTPEASEFILLVKAESSPFSPVTFGEFKDLTGKWRRAAGMTTPAFNDKLREAAAELVKISDQVRLLQEAVRTEEMLLVDADVIPEAAEKRLKDLRVALNRAIAEKERLQSDYNTLVAEFRQTEG